MDQLFPVTVKNTVHVKNVKILVFFFFWGLVREILILTALLIALNMVCLHSLSP